MIKKPRWLYATLILSISIILAACTGETSQDVYNNVASEMEETKIFTMFSEDINFNYESFNSPVARKITEKTGIKLEVEYPIINVEEKTSIMIASGDYPDFIMVKDTAQFADINAYIDLTDLIEEHAPNIKKLYDNYWSRLQYSLEDKSIYVLPSTPVEDVKLEPIMGFQLQHAVVKELGFPEIKTISDYENAIRSYMDLYPEIDGEKTIGISLLADDWRWLITLSNGAAFATGKPDDGQWFIDPVTQKATYRFLREEEKEYFRWLNHMYNSGLIDPDSFVQKYDAYEAKIISGRVLGLIDAKWQYQIAEEILLGQGKYIRTYGQYPVQMDETTTCAEFRNTGYQAGYGIGISVNCQDPVGAIKFLDYLVSEEGQVLRSWGIEGVNYFIDQNGERVLYEWDKQGRLYEYDYGKKTGVGAYMHPFPRYGLDVLDNLGQPLSVEDAEWLQVGYNPIEKEVLEAYSIDSWKQLYPNSDRIQPSSWGVAWNMPLPRTSGVSSMLKACNEVSKEGIINAIVAHPDNFDEQWDKMIEELITIGVYDMSRDFTQLIKDRVKIWNENN